MNTKQQLKALAEARRGVLVPGAFNALSARVVADLAALADAVAARERAVRFACGDVGGDQAVGGAGGRILDDADAWFGFEQDYFFYKNGRPLGFPEAGYPAPQGPYYTGVGYKNVGSIARQTRSVTTSGSPAASIRRQRSGCWAEIDRKPSRRRR